MSFLTGRDAKYKQISKLTPQQQKLHAQQVSAASGGFDQASNYYKDLLSNDSINFDQMAAPELRRFNEQIIPDLSEQFAGMGAGGLSSSGFRNAAVGAGTDLSERLGSIRAQLRSQGAAGLAGLAQNALNPTVENIREEPTEGFLQGIAPAVGTAVGAYFGGEPGAGLGNLAGQGLNKAISSKGKSSPYGANSRVQLPNYLDRR